MQVSFVRFNEVFLRFLGGLLREGQLEHDKVTVLEKQE